MATMMSSISDYWETNADKFSLTLPLLGNPLAFLATTTSMVILTKQVAPSLRSSCKNSDLKPLMMIMNGLIFGLIGIGFFAGLLLTRMGRDAFACDGLDPRNFDDLRVTCIKLIAFLYLIIKFMEFQRPFFAELRGHSNSDQYKSFNYYFYLFGQLSVSYWGAVFYPGGVFCLWPLLDAFVTIASYAYLILQLASPELRPYKLFKTIISAMRYGTFVTLAIHGAYFYLVPNCGNNFLLGVQAIYNGILVTVLTGQYVTRVESVKTSPGGTRLPEVNNNDSKNRR